MQKGPATAIAARSVQHRQTPPSRTVLNVLNLICSKVSKFCAVSLKANLRLTYRMQDIDKELF
jgi:hypothetical protein